MCSLAAVPRLRIDRLAPGLEVATATDLIQPFRPHQHDCYVVGLTSGGVQSFRYRGAQRHALPGQAFAIHPGETHDGRPGTQCSYGYRAVYIAPELISDALHKPAVPFVREVVNCNSVFVAALNTLFDLSPKVRDEIALSDCINVLAAAILAMSDCRQRRACLPDRQAALRLRDDLREHALTRRSMSDLEKGHGLNRFTISRLFRRHFGVSPHEYLVHQRVKHARSMIARRAALADIASASGFADQSHMTRHFTRTMGVTPGQWRKLTASDNKRWSRHPD